MYKLINGEAIEEMRKLKDKSVNLAIIDPPYNIGKDKVWDNQKDSDYYELMTNTFKEIDRILTDNGTMYFFHNNLPYIAQLMNIIDKETPDFCYNSFIVLVKGRPDTRLLAYANPKDSNKLHSWFTVCEYCLCYTKGQSSFSDFLYNKLGTNSFPSLREYAKSLCYYVNNNNTKGRYKLFKDKLGNDKFKHFMLFDTLQFSLPTKETYERATEIFNLKEWSGYREYDDLKREYDDLRPVHNLDKEHCNVWYLEPRKGKNYHSCQKPIRELRRLIRCSSNKGDTVLDCFMGSGSTGVAAKLEGRNFIGIEQDENYYKISQDRINSTSQI